MPGIKHLLVGPTEDEIINNLAGNPDELLIFASKEFSIRCAEAALNRGVSSIAKHHALISASKEGNLEFVQLLIKFGGNVHVKKGDALHETIYCDQLADIELLIANGEDIRTYFE
jgi:hypothetical protein